MNVNVLFSVGMSSLSLAYGILLAVVCHLSSLLPNHPQRLLTCTNHRLTQHIGWSDGIHSKKEFAIIACRLVYWRSSGICISGRQDTPLVLMQNCDLVNEHKTRNSTHNCATHKFVVDNSNGTPLCSHQESYACWACCCVILANGNQKLL